MQVSKGVMRIPIYQVDAFAEARFAGNPAAVCPLETWLQDETMQRIAMENNLSETAFFVRNAEEGYDLRWFTPAKEVDLCGHATLATAYVVSTYLDSGAERIVFHTRGGRLVVTRDGKRLTMDFPAKPPRAVERDVTAALGFAPQAVLATNKLMAVLESETQVLAAAPDLRAVAAWPEDGLIVTAPGATCDFVSRYFAPAAGIPEDPVTGSAHCVLTPYWAERLGKTELTARQVSSRGGALDCVLRGDRVLISGQVVPYLEGIIHVEDVSVRAADGAADLAAVRRLFEAYADWLQADVCLCGFKAELASLPGDYVAPRGGLWLALDQGTAVGVVALRPLAPDACEIKRLYVDPKARGRGLGRRLIEACIKYAKLQNYRYLRLETLKDDRMKSANKLYTTLGFRETSQTTQVRALELNLKA